MNKVLHLGLDVHKESNLDAESPEAQSEAESGAAVRVERLVRRHFSGFSFFSSGALAQAPTRFWCASRSKSSNLPI